MNRVGMIDIGILFALTGGYYLMHILFRVNKIPPFILLIIARYLIRRSLINLKKERSSWKVMTQHVLRWKKIQKLNVV